MKKIEKEFEFIGGIIDRHWNRAIGLANAESLMTYWTIGAFVSLRLKSAEWGAKTVEALCDYLKTRKPALKGYGRRNIYNMVAFYESYSSVEFNSVSERLRLDEFVQMPSAQIEQGAIVQPLSAQICESGVLRPVALKRGNKEIVQMASAQFDEEQRCLNAFPLFLALTTFSNHLEILGRCHSMEEKVFYILYAARERLTHKEMRQSIAAQTYETVMSKEKKMSRALKAAYPSADFLLKDRVFVDFLRLPEKHNERRLHAGLVEHIKEFILALGKDFLWMGSEYAIQVGGKRRRLDLLFYHRALRCLVDVELKAVPFEPEFVGKMDFYLSAIDHEIKRENENPTVGIILCPSAGRCDVRYALDRTMSPMMVAEYKRLLIPEDVMKRSLAEYCEFIKTENVNA
jgi:predicted nuclease of restriction endonuclease-like (RecB) superfamily